MGEKDRKRDRVGEREKGLGVRERERQKDREGWEKERKNRKKDRVGERDRVREKNRKRGSLHTLSISL